MVRLVWGGLSDTDAAVFAEFLMNMNTAGWTPTDDAVPTIEPRTTDPVPKSRATDTGRSDWRRSENIFLRHGSTWLSRQPRRRRKTQVDEVVAKHSAALAQAFRGSLAPVRQIITEQRLARGGGSTNCACSSPIGIPTGSRTSWKKPFMSLRGDRRRQGKTLMGFSGMHS